MNVPRSHSLYNPAAHVGMLAEIPYDQEMSALLVDMTTTEIPGRCLFGAAQHTRDLFELAIFCSQMFEARNLPNDLYLIQKQYLVPGDIVARAKLCTGYMLLGLFSKEPFQEHFPLLCRTAIAVNKGYLLLDDALATDADFESLSSRISNMNARMGNYKSSGPKRRRQENMVGSFRSTHDFDSALERYHLYLLPVDDEGENWQTSLAEEVRGSDLDEAWSLRAELLSPEYVFGKSCRMTGAYRNLIHLAHLVRPGEFADYRPTLRNLSRISSALGEQDVVVDLFRHYLKTYQWHKLFRESDAPGSWHLDLRNQVAWKVEDSHKLDMSFFHEHTFYTIFSGCSQSGSQGDRLQTLTSHTNIDEYTKRVWQETINQLFDPHRSASVSSEDLMKNRFASLYPAMANLKELFGSLARVLKEDGQVSGCYQNPHFGRFFLSVYDDVMKGGSFDMSEARKVQYRCHPRILAWFKNGCLNGSWREDTASLPPAASRRLAAVEPTQDLLANQLLLFASVCGICHLSTEFFLCLFANVLSFTSRKEKPMIVLDGPSGAGKSYMTHCVQAVVVGNGETQNSYACVEEHYATTRSHTVSLQDPYCSVLGQRLIEEWQSGSRNNNPYLDNVSLESVTMKNIFDHGMSCSQRCRNVKDKNKEERIVRSVEFALTDRSTMILANGFHVCSSIEERCMVYRVPDLTARVALTSPDRLVSVLDHHKVPQLFSLLRYLISEQYNRDALGLSLKGADHVPDLDQREIDLTFSRMEVVFQDMGFSSKQILTHRRKIQILKFAELLAHWRAVLEVYGSVHWDCAVRPPHQEESLRQYNGYLCRAMTDHLGSLGSDERDKRLAARVVIDPSDILSASTLVLQFDKSDRRLLRILCCHLADPSVFEQVEPWGANYLHMENVTVRRICDELKKRSLPVLKESLAYSLAILEDTMLKSNVPYLIRRFDASGINKHREKEMQQFSLLVNAGHAATVYAQENGAKLKQLTDILAQHLVQCARGERQCNWTRCSQVRGLKIGYLKVPIPAELARCCSYLYHLPLEPRPFMSHEGRKCPHEPDLAEVEVNVDFGWSRLKALQRLLVDHLCHLGSSDGDGNDLQWADDSGFVAVPVQNTQIFSFGPSYASGPRVGRGRGVKLGELEQHGTLSIHASVFLGKFRSGSFAELRNAVIDRCLRREKLADRDFFQVRWSNFHDVKRWEEILHQAVPDIACRTESIFKVTNGVVHIHLSLLNSIPLWRGVMEEEVNTGRVMVEKALCMNMTDQSSVLVFDREKVYRTQNLADALSFVDVNEASLRQHENDLPWHWMPEPEAGASDADTEKWDICLCGKLQNCRKEGDVTFHKLHRQRKLALKHVLKESLWETAPSRQERKKLLKRGSKREWFLM